MSNQEDIASRPRGPIGAWLDASAHLADGVLRANRSLLSPFERDEERSGEAPGVVYTEHDWSVETRFAEEGEVSVGDVVEFSKTLEQEEVRSFAAASGDTNRLHLDDEYAGESRFGGTIVHGTLVSGLISAALARLPGVVVYLSQETTFVGPVDPGQEASAVCEVVESLGGGRFRITTDVFADGDPAVEGEAVVLIEDPPE
jgi:acyl dehydratase